MRRAVVTSMVTAIVGIAPLAALCALLYRFPIPLAAYMSGPKAVALLPSALLFYGIFLGGIPLLALIAGGLAATISGWLRPRKEIAPTTNTKIGLIAGLGVDVVAIALLANWDHIYGPW